MSRPRLVLLPVGPEHAEVLWGWRQEAMFQQFNPVLPLTSEQLRIRLTELGSDPTDRRYEEYRWVLGYGADLVGTVSLKGVSFALGRAEIGYHLAEQWHGRGLGTEACRLLVDKAFRGTPLERVFALIAVENVASQRIVEKLGFTKEGCLRQHVVLQGRRIDQLVYGILRAEWAQI